MKTLIRLLAVTLAISACDKIPVGERIVVTGKTCGECDIQASDEFITQKQVLMEEFTAQGCTYCPDGTRIAQAIKDQYGDQFIIVSLHTGPLAAPTTDHPQDFRTDEGNGLYKLAASPPQPAALLDRLDYNTSTFVKYRQGDGWSNEVNAILTAQPTADMGINAEAFHIDSTNSICLTTKFRAESDLQNRNLNWTAYLLESDITAPQKDGSTVIEDYEHNHMFRRSFTFNYEGVPLPEEFSGISGDVICDSRQLDLEDDWLVENCEIVVFVYDTDTFEVLQAIEVHID